MNNKETEEFEVGAAVITLFAALMFLIGATLLTIGICMNISDMWMAGAFLAGLSFMTGLISFIFAISW
jgi:hypothetical protein